MPDWVEGLRFSLVENQLYLRAAQRNGMEIEHWVRHALNRAAREQLRSDGIDAAAVTSPVLPAFDEAAFKKEKP